MATSNLAQVDLGTRLYLPPQAPRFFCFSQRGECETPLTGDKAQVIFIGRETSGHEAEIIRFGNPSLQPIKPASASHVLSQLFLPFSPNKLPATQAKTHS